MKRPTSLPIALGALAIASAVAAIVALRLCTLPSAERTAAGGPKPPDQEGVEGLRDEVRRLRGQLSAMERRNGASAGATLALQAGQAESESSADKAARLREERMNTFYSEAVDVQVTARYFARLDRMRETQPRIAARPLQWRSGCVRPSRGVPS